MQKKLFVTAALLAWSLLVSSSDFLKNCEKTFALSCDRWICRELYNADPDAFQCGSIQPSTLLAEFPHNLQGLGYSTNASPEILRSFHEVYFPGNNCYRFLMLKSLSDLYFPLFERKLQAHGLPSEFKFFALIISGLDTRYEGDPARAGLWGMNYLVARSYHMRVDSLIDERRGADFTTDVMISHLSSLYETCRHDPLRTIIACYHSLSWLENHDGTKPHLNIDDLDAETKTFIRFFFYTAMLWEKQPTENRLEDYFNILGNFESLFFKETADIRALQALLGTRPDQFHDTNPVYAGNSVPGNYKKVPVILPKEQAQKFLQIEDSVYKWRFIAPEQTSSKAVQKIYVVRSGDSLGKIASRHGVTVKELKQWNKLRKDKIFPGQKLRLYSSTN